MSNNAAIGIFDSGVGGLTVSQAIRKLLPSEDIIYVADTGHAPYGEKSSIDIQERCINISEFLVKQDVKAIVVACNTATVATIDLLRARFCVPIIGVEPGVKPAIQQSKNGIVGILATSQTIKSESVARLIERFGKKNEVRLQGCPGLVEAIEGQRLEMQETVELLKNYILPLIDMGVDTLVLGCTHYAFLIPLLKKILGELSMLHIQIITTHDAVAAQLGRQLNENRIEAETKGGWSKFYSSGNSRQSSLLFSHLLGETVEVYPLCPEAIIT